VAWAPQLTECHGCGHTTSGTDVDLPTDSNALFESADYGRWRLVDDEVVRTAAQRIDVLTPYAAGGQALELGCSTGEATADLANRGWQAFGLEPSEFAFDVACERYPQAAFAHGLFPTLPADWPADFDLIVAFHVIEHIQDLESLARDLRARLRPGGLLYVRVPNWASWSRLITRQHWPNLFPEHLHHFTPASLERFVESAGAAPIAGGTSGHAHEWVGGLRRSARRLRPREQRSSPPPLIAGAMRINAMLDRVGRPWFWLEEHRHAGSELWIIGRRR